MNKENLLVIGQNLSITYYIQSILPEGYLKPIEYSSLISEY